jgi:hypothetical protein
VPLFLCVSSSPSPEVVFPSSLTDIPLLPGSPRRLSPRTVPRGGHGPTHVQQYLKVPAFRGPRQWVISNRYSGHASERARPHSSSVSTRGGLALMEALRESLSWDPSRWGMCVHARSPGVLLENFSLLSFQVRHSFSWLEDG